MISVITCAFNKLPWSHCGIPGALDKPRARAEGGKAPLSNTHVQGFEGLGACVWDARKVFFGNVLRLIDHVPLRKKSLGGREKGFEIAQSQGHLRLLS